MELDVRITGVRELSSRYRNAERVIRPELLRAVTRIVIQGERVSKQLVEKDTHTLERSITHEAMPMAGGVRGAWGTASPYAVYRERGTRPHFVPARYIGDWARRHGFGYTGLRVSGRATPFIRPAFERLRGPAGAELRAAMRRALAQLAGR